MDTKTIDSFVRPFDRAIGARRDAGAHGGDFFDALKAHRAAAEEPAPKPPRDDPKARPAERADAPPASRPADPSDEAAAATADEAPPPEAHQPEAVAVPVDPAPAAAPAPVRPQAGAEAVVAADGAVPPEPSAAAAASTAPAVPGGTVDPTAATASAAPAGGTPAQADGVPPSAAGTPTPPVPTPSEPTGAAVATAAQPQPSRAPVAVEPTLAGEAAGGDPVQTAAGPGAAKGGQESASNNGQGQQRQSQAQAHGGAAAPAPSADPMAAAPDAVGFARSLPMAERGDAQPFVLTGAAPAAPSSTLLSTTALTASQAANAPLPASEQVVLRLQKAVAESADRISMSLKPADLGRVDVQLDVGADGRVQATVSVDRPETLTLLQRDARGLEQALQNAGLQTDGDSLNFTLRQQAHDRDGGAGGGFRGSGRDGDPADGEPTPPPPSRRVSLGGIDLKV